MSALNEWFVIIGVVVVGIMNKPTDQELMNSLSSTTKYQLANSNSMALNKDDNFWSGLSKFGCAMDLDTCSKIVVASFDVTTNGLGPIRIATAKNKEGKDVLNCVGAFRNWWCR